MTQIQSNNDQTYDDAIELYALGQLSPAKHMIISCQRKLSKEVGDRVEIEEAVASSVLDDVSIQPLSSSFLSNAVANLPAQSHGASVNDNKMETDFGEAIQNVKWNKFTPLVSVHNIIGSRHSTNSERLYLIRVKAGAKLPKHSHSGEEWVLLLKGSYKSNGKVYERGDVHMVDDNETHSLDVSEDEDCICLAMSEENIKMTGILPRIAQKVIGI